ncbi:MAG: hypothetical protein M1820_009811 [Bogoriella megaspora]|nr:MAG: hypothetical protein M1820_009811 [Bogoriella megaspora]
MSRANELPGLRAYMHLEAQRSDNINRVLYDVQFYPWNVADEDPVFAVTGREDVLVCRAVSRNNDAVEILQWIKDGDLLEEKVGTDDRSHTLGSNSLTWAQSPVGEPLVCVSGGYSKVKLYNALTGTLYRVLHGHGSSVNDLKTSPQSPSIIASASYDRGIRLWDLGRSPDEDPCAVLCSGGGHREGVLAMGFHRSGRYLLSGGLDQAINLWVLPDLQDRPTNFTSCQAVHYPHFSTTELHNGYVDCVTFFDDLVLSKAAEENRIVLWKIDGFSSRNSPPKPETAPTISQLRGTRSAFGNKFQRLLQFGAPKTDLFYMRFSLFHEFDKSPILVIGDEKSALHWWDLQRLEEDNEFDFPSSKARGPRKQKDKTALWAMREPSITSEASSSRASVNPGPTVAKRKSPVSDPFTGIPSHKKITVPRVGFPTRQIAWSKGGEWMVAVGDWGMICLFKRWD